MRLLVLGAAAGGGLPQWNCGCDNCRAARAGDPRVEARTQDALALSADGARWLLINASPDVLAQIGATPALQPREGRATPIAGVVLTNGDLDHVLGLFSLRESTPLVVFATRAVQRGLERNAMLRTLRRFEGHLTFATLELDRSVDALGVELTAFALPGKLPKHLEGASEASAEDNVGLELRHGGARAVVATAAAALGSWTTRADGADLALFDGTFWSSDELVRLGLGTARAEEMAHLPVGGDRGSLRGLAASTARRKIFTHINNTNPMLVVGSAERDAVEAAGFEVARDGMELSTVINRDAFVEQLRRIGHARYHDKHPFHARMHAGELSPASLRRWVENRFYYQTRIPIKDALVLSKSDDPAFRRAWLHRVVDHDGEREGEGGIALWLRLAEGVGLERGRVARCENVLPAVRFACDAYVTLVRERTLLEAVASSLTEFFAPDLMTTRIAAWEQHYPWVDGEMLAYFRGRVPKAKRDSGEALAFVLEHATTEAQQDACARALTTKCDILWAMLDAIAAAPDAP